MLMVSKTVLSVPMLMVLPAFPVPIAMVLTPVSPVPRLMVSASVSVPMLMVPVEPELRVRALVVVDSMVPAPAKVMVVAETAMVSILATPVKIPPVVTLRPPFEVKAKVPVALPIVVLSVPEALIWAVPVTVNPPVPSMAPVPEFTPTAVTAPAPVTEKLVPVMALAPMLMAFVISTSDTSNPSVITPLAATLTSMPLAIVKSVSRFSTKRSCVGDSVDTPALLEIETKLSATVSISRFESVDVSARVISISRASVVVMALPAMYDPCKEAPAAPTSSAHPQVSLVLFHLSISSIPQPLIKESSSFVSSRPELEEVVEVSPEVVRVTPPPIAVQALPL